MSGDELIAGIVGGVAALVGWAMLLLPVLTTGSRLRRGGRAYWLFLLPVVAAAIIWLVLTTISARDVRSDQAYILMYFAIGAGWTGVTLASLTIFSIRSIDVVERNNPATLIVFIGATIGFACAFAGGNIGDGPGWWVVVLSALFSTATVYAVLLVNILVARATYRIAVDADLGIALRLGAMLTCAGLVAGRGVGGTWVSSSALISDWAAATAVLVPFVVIDAIATRWVAAPTRRWPWALDAGAALLYLVLAGGYVFVRGVPA